MSKIMSVRVDEWATDESGRHHAKLLTSASPWIEVRIDKETDGWFPMIWMEDLNYGECPPMGAPLFHSYSSLEEAKAVVDDWWETEKRRWMKAAPADMLLTPKEAAELLGLSPKSGRVQKLYKDGKLRGEVIGGNIFLDRRSVEERKQAAEAGEFDRYTK